MKRGPAAAALAIAAFVVIVVGVGFAAASAAGLGADRGRLALTLAALGLHFAAAAALAIPSFVDRLRRFLDGRSWRTVLVAAALLSPYLLYWAIPGTARLAWLSRVVAWVATPTLVAILWPRRWVLTGEALITLLVWLPVEFHWVKKAYPWPAGGNGAILAAPLGLSLMVFLFAVVRGWSDLGYVARVDRRDLLSAGAAFLGFAAIGIPLGLWSGFLRPAAAWPGPVAILLRGVMIFLLTAVPEETCFRGLIQGYFARLTGRPIVSLAAASLVFGAAHLNNGPVPDWRYAVLATLAGLAYGWTYMRTRRLAAPALTHLLVDLTWSVVFKG
ncbi:MAG TPA: type II CAAX endopeptidase family protein [Patescibacteria group bacterium]|nr:type II CAAX endopeptidase family protein [Patescibacteria group bacterium]